MATATTTTIAAGESEPSYEEGSPQEPQRLERRPALPRSEAPSWQWQEHQQRVQEGQEDPAPPQAGRTHWTHGARAPGPHAAAHDRYFTATIEKYAFRHHVKSGMTGWAQVSGARGETDTLEKMQRRVELDLWYINNWSLSLDLRTIFSTFVALVKYKSF